MVSLQ